MDICCYPSLYFLIFATKYLLLIFSNRREVNQLILSETIPGIGLFAFAIYGKW